MYINCIFRAVFIRNELVLFAEYVTVRYPWNFTPMNIMITGITPDIVLLNKIKRIKTMMEDLKTDLKTSFETKTNNLKAYFKATLTKELDKRYIGWGRF